MAIAGSGTPAVRVYVYNRQMHFSGYIHNVPDSVIWEPLYAAAYFYDNPSYPGIYIGTVGGGTIELAELLEEMDIIDPIFNK